jgi:hypothetical protein
VSDWVKGVCTPEGLPLLELLLELLLEPHATSASTRAPAATAATINLSDRIRAPPLVVHWRHRRITVPFAD